MAKKGKITVKHYLNTRLKPVEKRYPLYIQIIVSGKKTQVKSNVLRNKSIRTESYWTTKLPEYNDYFTESEFNEIMNDYNSEIRFEIITEAQGIKNFIEFLNPFSSSNFRLTDFNIAYASLQKQLKGLIEYELVDEIKSEIDTYSDYWPITNVFDHFEESYQLYDFFNFIEESGKCKIDIFRIIYKKLKFVRDIMDIVEKFSENHVFLVYELFLKEKELLEFVEKSFPKLKNESRFYNQILTSSQRIKRNLKREFYQNN